MNTPLILDSEKSAGSDCSAYGKGAIARDSTGALLVCKSPDLKFEPIGSNYWSDPVDTFESLPVCTASIANQTRIVKTPTIGTERRAYTCNGAGTWDPLFQDDYGNISVPGTANISKLSGSLEITTIATENTACSPNGRIASNANGLILSCQSGLWKKASGGSAGTRNGIEYSDISINSCNSGSFCVARAICSSGKTLATYSCFSSVAAVGSNFIDCQAYSNSMAIAYCK